MSATDHDDELVLGRRAVRGATRPLLAKLGELFEHELKRLSVLAVLGVQAATQVVVELVGLDLPESACLVDVPAALECHFVHYPEDVSARCFRGPDAVRVESAERVDGQSFLEQGAFEQGDDSAFDRT